MYSLLEADIRWKKFGRAIYKDTVVLPKPRKTKFLIANFIVGKNINKNNLNAIADTVYEIYLM